MVEMDTNVLFHIEQKKESKQDFRLTSTQ